MYSIYSYKMLDMFPVAMQPLLVDYFIPSSLSLLTPCPSPSLSPLVTTSLFSLSVNSLLFKKMFTSLLYFF